MHPELPSCKSVDRDRSLQRLLHIPIVVVIAARAGDVQNPSPSALSWIQESDFVGFPGSMHRVRVRLHIVRLAVVVDKRHLAASRHCDIPRETGCSPPRVENPLLLGVERSDARLLKKQREPDIEGWSRTLVVNLTAFLEACDAVVFRTRPMDPVGPMQNAQTAFRTGPWTALENAPPTGSTGPHP